MHEALLLLHRCVFVTFITGASQEFVLSQYCDVFADFFVAQMTLD